MLSLLVGPAFAQAKPSGMDDKPPPAEQTQQQKDSERAAVQAYQRSLGNIPDKAPADPWGGARNLDAPKAGDKSAPTKVGASKKKPPA
jgi:hypothetical protein